MAEPMGGLRGRRSACLRLVLAAACAVLLPAQTADAQAGQRPFRVDDLFELESVGRYYGGPYAFASSGPQLAFTRVRPKKSLRNHKWEYLWGNAGGDVWVQRAPGQRPVNITNGARDGSGWWAPQWSPDGRRLAMLSTRGGDVRLWLWEAGSGALRPLTTRNVDLTHVHERPFAWVDSDRILVAVLPPDQKPLGMTVELQTPGIATREWPLVAAGESATASVLSSGVPVSLEERPAGGLLLVDASRERTTTLSSGLIRSWRLSPRGDAVAVIRAVRRNTPRAGEPLAFGGFTGEVSVLEVVGLDGHAYSFSSEWSRDVLEESARWSPDGDAVAFFGHAAGDRPPLVYRLDLSNGSVRSWSLDALSVSPVVREEAQLHWTATGALILQAAPATGGELPDVRSRRDWWLLDGAGEPTLLTGEMDTPPRVLWPEPGGRSFVGVAAGALWRVDPETGTVEDLTRDFDREVSHLAWPAATNFGTDQYHPPGGAYDEVIFAVRDGRVLSYHHVDLRSRRIRDLETPAEGAELVAYEPAERTAVYYVSDRQGLGIWRGDLRSGRMERLVEANGFLREIAEGDLLRLEYTSLDGERLSGWVILPVGYERGRRYPLLTWVYPGSVYGEAAPSGYLTSINSNLPVNMQLPAARGYAVLLPSMPLKPEGLTDDPMLRLTTGVLPAVDRAIELGIADPDRLFVAGQSFGGYATYGLVTQTQRFDAAISLAGLSNLISLYGQFDARMRYTEHPHEHLFQMSLAEAAQVRMGGPPWTDLGRYIRNSPIFSVDRVETPIMIIQGDLDYVAIQQGEEFFMSLYRQGKRAEFVRYWGEGHVLQSPANIHDMWSRIFGWLDAFSPSGSTN